MGSNIAGLFHVFVFLFSRAVYAETSLFVHIGSSHGNGNGEDRDVHHNHFASRMLGRGHPTHDNRGE
ncbi:hypothetical protein TMatcc_007184 [Talaromyces marneffei ATCC 18224]